MLLETGFQGVVPVAAGEKQMKRGSLAVFILSVLFACLSQAVFASLLDFKVVWVVNTEESSRLDILQYSNSAAWEDFDGEGISLKEVTPVNDTALANICRVRFTTNKGGRRVLTFSATPLENTQDNTDKVGYTLALSNEGNLQFLEVGTAQAQSATSVVIYMPFTSGFSFSDVLVDAVFSSLDDMVAGNYVSTVTVGLEGI